MKLMTVTAFQQEREASGKWTRASLSSTQLSTYFVGVSEHNEIRAEAIVVEQRVVDIEQEHDTTPILNQHGRVSSGFGSCQPSSPATTARAAAGPQASGSYSATGTALSSIGSTTRHAASTTSSRVKSVASP